VPDVGKAVTLGMPSVNEPTREPNGRERPITRGRLNKNGWGGRSNGDGNNAVNSITGNSRMNPVEVFETRFPWRVDALELVPDSGGPGKFRGGLALRKVYSLAKNR
jgi:N-methylhydantoinase B/oxoprolinase/acetone carboxylase alpha subunit